MAGQVLPSAEGNIRQKMADLQLDLASQQVKTMIISKLLQLEKKYYIVRSWQLLNKWSYFLGRVTPHIWTLAPTPIHQ